MTTEMLESKFGVAGPITTAQRADAKKGLADPLATEFGVTEKLATPQRLVTRDVVEDPLAKEFGIQGDPGSMRYGLQNIIPEENNDDGSMFFKIKQALMAPVKYQSEVTKAEVRTLENFASGVGAVIEIFGDSIINTTLDRAAGKQLGMSDATLNKYDDFAKGIRDIGKTAKDFWADQQTSGWEVGDPEIFRGSFMENPSFTRLASGVAGGVTSIGIAFMGGTAAMMMGAPVGLSTLAGASLLGFTEVEDVYFTVKDNMLRRGMSEDKAKATALLTYGLTAAAFTAIEKFQFDWWLKGGTGTLWKDIIGNIATEAAEEGSQTVLHNTVLKTAGGDEARSLWEGLAESMIVGGLTGGIFGGMTSQKVNRVDSIIKKALKNGATQADLTQAYKIMVETIKRNNGVINEASRDRISKLLALQKTVIQEKNKKNMEANVEALPKKTAEKKPIDDMANHPGNSEEVIKYLARYLPRETIIGLSAEERHLLYNDSKTLRDFAMAPDTWPAVQQKKTAAVAAIDKAVKEGKTDVETGNLAKFLVTEVNPDFDADASIEFTNEVKNATPDILAKEGIKPQQGTVYKIFGSQRLYRENQILRSAIALYKDHDPDTLVHEWYHDAYERLTSEEKDAFTEYWMTLAADKRSGSVREHFANEGRDYFFKRGLYKPVGTIQRIFEKFKESLLELVGRIKEMDLSKIPKPILDMYEEAGAAKRQKVVGYHVIEKKTGKIVSDEFPQKKSAVRKLEQLQDKTNLPDAFEIKKVWRSVEKPKSLKAVSEYTQSIGDQYDPKVNRPQRSYQIRKEYQKTLVKIVAQSAEGLKPHEMGRLQFENTFANGIVKYILDMKTFSRGEVLELTKQLIEAGIMSSEDIGGIALPLDPTLDQAAADYQSAISMIGDANTLYASALFAHRQSIIKALVAGKKVSKSIIDYYKDFGWIEKDGTTAYPSPSGMKGVTLKQAVESYGVKFKTSLISKEIKQPKVSEYAKNISTALDIQKRLDKLRDSGVPLMLSNEDKTWLEDNDEYIKSVDPDLLCQKSEGVDIAINRLKTLLKKKYDSDMAWDVFARAYAKGLKVPCPQCYVFWARKKSGNSMQKRFVIGVGGYNGEVTRMAGETLEAIITRGLRHYSSTDFKVEHLPGLIIELVESKEKGVPTAGYTKDFDFVEIFSPTGAYINISVGRDSKVGADMERAKKMRLKYGNTSTIYVAYNDAEVLKALRDPEIDHVIPWHSSSAKLEDMKAILGSDDVTDYTDQQNETYINKNGVRVKVGYPDLNEVGWKSFEALSNADKKAMRQAIKDFDKAAASEIFKRNELPGSLLMVGDNIKEIVHGGDLGAYLEAVEKKKKEYKGFEMKFPKLYELLGPGEKYLYMKMIGPEYGKFARGRRDLGGGKLYNVADPNKIDTSDLDNVIKRREEHVRVGNQAFIDIADQIIHEVKTKTYEPVGPPMFARGVLPMEEDFSKRIIQQKNGVMPDPVQYQIKAVKTPYTQDSQAHPVTIVEPPKVESEKKTALYEKVGSRAKVRRARAGENFLEWKDKLFVPISTRMAKINEGLKHVLRKLDFEIGIQNQADIEKLTPFLEKFKAMEETDKRKLDFAFKNRDQQMVEKLLKKHKMVEAFVPVRTILNRLYKEAAEAGLDIGFIQDYYPRSIEDPVGFLQFLRKTEHWGIIEEAIRETEKARGETLDDEERVELINRLIRGYGATQINLALPGNVKARSIQFLTPEMNDFYKDGVSALVDYIEAMNNAIKARKFFGRGEEIDNSIGDYVNELVKSKSISPAQEMEVRNILKARFSQRGTHGFIKAYKNLNYIATMGSSISAVTQIGDIAFSLYKNGAYTTTQTLSQAVAGQSEVTKADIGIDKIAQEFSDDVGSGKAVRAVFRAVGLEWMDNLGKSTFINGALRRLRKLANENNKAFKVHIDTIFGDEADQTMADLKAGKVSHNVKYLLFSELAEIMPISLSEMPEQYLIGGNARVFYMLKTYTIKLLDVYHNDIFRGLKDHPVQSLQNFIKLTAALMMMGISSDLIKDILLGRKIKASDYFFDNVVKLMGFSRWHIYKAKRDGLFMTALQSVLPPVPFADDIWFDITRKMWSPTDWKVWQRVPLVGKFYYWWFGGGRTLEDTKGKRTQKLSTV